MELAHCVWIVRNLAFMPLQETVTLDLQLARTGGRGTMREGATGDIESRTAIL
jgi:hypothetical protein